MSSPVLCVGEEPPPEDSGNEKGGGRLWCVRAKVATPTTETKRWPGRKVPLEKLARTHLTSRVQ